VPHSPTQKTLYAFAREWNEAVAEVGMIGLPLLTRYTLFLSIIEKVRIMSPVVLANVAFSLLKKKTVLWSYIASYEAIQLFSSQS
jgi:hypothetical protein